MHEEAIEQTNYQIFILPLVVVLVALLVCVGLLLSTQSFLGDSNVSGQETVVVKTSIDDDPYLGNKDKAKVAIVEWTDYECTFCKQYFNTTYNQIKKEYVDTGKVAYVLKDLPVRSTHGQIAFDQAHAAECVQELGGNEKYFQYHDLLFKNSKSNGTTQKSILYDLASQVGVDKDTFKECLDTERHKDEVLKDIDESRKVNQLGTPHFVIGKLDKKGNISGASLSGAQSYDAFKAIIDQQLSR